MVCLEWMGEVISEYPSPIEEQRLGKRERGLDTLVQTLGKSNPANFDFFLPTRALLGRALVMAEANFYRLLLHVCADETVAGCGTELSESIQKRLRLCLYTKLVEEVLSALACDDSIDVPVRSKSVVALAQIWERRMTYRVSDFFPVLDATWEARRRVKAVGGTLAGMQEMFELFNAGCDPQFVDFFIRPNPSEDEIEAFREFLFGKTTEELNRIRTEMAEGDALCVNFDKESKIHQDGAGITGFYEFFRSRYLQAMARNLANLPGPKRTAEGYVMISYLEQMG
jgi:hypothetical protein